MVDVTKGTFSRKAWENASDARISAKFAKENADIALGKAQDAMVIAEDARKNADIASQRLARLRQDSGKVEGASKEIDLRKTQSRVSDNLAVEERNSVSNYQFRMIVLEALQTSDEAIVESFAQENARAKNMQIEAEIVKNRANEQAEVSRKAMLRAEELAKAEGDRAKAAAVFLISLIFCAGAIGGFVVVGQMLTDYGSCVVLS